MKHKNYYEDNEKEERQGGSVIPAVRAGILGAGIAALTTYFFYGTEKGLLARKKISKAAQSAKNKAMESTDDLIQSGKEIYDDMTTLFEEKKEQIKNLDSKDIAGLVKRLHDRWEETKEDIEETLADAE